MKILESPLKDTPREYAVREHAVWHEIAKYFKPVEFNRPYKMDVGFLRLLFAIRKDAEVPMKLTSDARDPDGNIGAKDSAHKKWPARVIDGQVSNTEMMAGSEQLARIFIAAVQNGCVRMGVYKSKWSGAGNIYHIDAETHDENPSPRMWMSWK